MYALNLDTDGRILSACVCLGDFEYNNVVANLPDSNITDYKYIDGQYVYDPLPKPPEPEPSGSDYVTYDELAAAIREGVNSYGR